MSKGLLLGAGFSVELGMPTLREFSQAFFNFLTPNILRSLITIMKSYEPYGNNNPTDKIEYEILYVAFIKFLNSGIVNYEALLRCIDDEQCNDRPKKLAKDHFLGKLEELINESFFIFQTQTYSIYKRNRELYKQLFCNLAEHELWIFSLNHDVIIEMLCKDFGINLYIGGNKTIQLPFNNVGSKRTITFTEVDNTETNLNNLHFAREEKGVNLIKLHGGINEFIYNDDEKRMFILPLENQTLEEYLSELEGLLHKPHYFHLGSPILTGGEIVIPDSTGEMQFLRPSILSGSKKYSPTIEERKGEEKMIFFSNIIEQIDELYVIGYGFGDEHINNRILKAMYLNQNMKIWIVDPVSTKKTLLNAFDYGLRVRGINATATQAIGYITTNKWPTNKEEAELNIVLADRSEIYDRLNNVTFKRD
jgi:hypothetical protein